MSRRNHLILFSALLGLAVLIGCGSSNVVKPNPQGFSNSSLSGTYVFSTEGSDVNNNILLLAGAFMTSGTGSITGGTMDAVDPGVTPPSPVAQAITSGSYNVGTDGRGKVTLTSSIGTFTFAFVLTGVLGGPSSVSAHGLISEFDGHGSGSGTIDLQTAIASVTGPYAFALGGADSSASSFAMAGAFTLDSSGTMKAGVEDYNDAGATNLGQALTGAATLGSGTGPGTIALNTSRFNLTFDFYPIDSTHWKLIETDYIQFLAGDAFTQTGASIPNGPMVFTMSGGITGPIAAGGLMNSDGTGNFSNGLEDYDDTGNISPTQVAFSGTAAGTGPTGGRVVVNLTNFFPAAQWVIYPSSGGLVLLETDAANVMLGSGLAQTATAFAAGASAGYGLNLAGANVNSGVDDIAQFNASTGTSNNMTGVLDENDQGFSQMTTGLRGTYTPDSPATGRGLISVPNIGTANGTLNLAYYVADSSTALVIEGDLSQVTAGIFESQSSALDSVQAGHASAMARPLGRTHTVKRSK